MSGKKLINKSVMFILKAHQVQAMFPHMPFNIIMEDLRHTHSLEVTTDNILEGNIAVPSVSALRESVLKHC